MEPPTRKKGESHGEFICRKVLTEIYQKPFPSTRPDFLKSPVTGQNLELDGYNAELQIAFEYNGSQHFVFPNKFHKTKEAFLEQVKRDIWKFQQCDLNGIYLINVPYYIDHSEIHSFIERFLPENVQKRMEVNLSLGVERIAATLGGTSSPGRSTANFLEPPKDRLD